MQKNAPSIPRLLTMVVFALSCFALLLFLWLSFGGPIPLQPESYRFKAAFPEAATLAQEADVRMAGVNVGKVKTKELDKGGARTITEIEIDDSFAPIPTDTRAILRQKTLLGETYVELTPGNPETGMLPEDGTLPDASVEQSTELDEILRIFDPETRNAFRAFTEENALAIERGTAEDLNDALGNLPEFSDQGAEVLGVLDDQEEAVQQLVSNTGTVFRAINSQEGALRELIVNANNTFEATAQEKEALAETIQIFPTFLQESRLTLDRLNAFSRDTNPLINDLKPVADDLGPTVRDLGRLSPDLERVFRDLDPVIRSGERTLPDAQRFLLGAEPVLEGLHSFLPELTPILSFANFYRGELSDFTSVGGVALNQALPPGPNDPTRVHALPQFALIGGNSPDFGQTTQDPETRGNSYIGPNTLTEVAPEGVIQSFDCSQTGGIMEDPTEDAPPCQEQGDYGWPDGGFYPLIRGSMEPLEGSGRIPRPTPFPRQEAGAAP